jgi:O-antigen ligase
LLCLLFALVWAPIPLGSNRPWALGLLVILLWAVLLALSARALWRREVPAWLPRLRHGGVPLGLLVGFALLIVAQLLPWPGTWRTSILPADVLPGAPGPGPLSLDPFGTHTYLLTTLAYLAAFMLVVGLVDSTRRATWLLATLVASGVFQAILAIVLSSSGATYNFFFYEFKQGERAMGTFPNPDHLAGYMELCLSAGLGLMLAHIGGAQSALRNWRTRMVAALQFIMSKKMLLRAVLVIMVIALVMTHSRMGNAAFFFALVVVGALVAAVSPRLRVAALWLVASMVLVDAIIIGQWVGIDRVVSRFENTNMSLAGASQAGGIDTVDEAALQRQFREESLEQRLRAPEAGLRLVAESPYIGHGGGTFYTAFPRFKPNDDFILFWDHAHNDYVEVACDMGLLGLALWVGIGAATLWRCVRMMGDQQPRLNRGAGVAGAMGLVAIGTHSLVDFNLQIPANALTLVTLLALPWALQMSAAGRRAQRARPVHSPGALT